MPRFYSMPYIAFSLILLFISNAIEAKWVWRDDDTASITAQNSVSFSDIFGQNQQLKSSDNLPSLSFEGSPGSAGSKDEERQFVYLDVHHPDSPYGLIQDVLKQKRPPNNFRGSEVDLGGLDSNEVWLSQGNLLVLKGGITNIGENDWPPLDNYIAPYREPILSPTTSNSLHPYADIGNAKENGIITILPPPKKFRQDENQPKKIVNQRLPRNFFLPSLQYATNTNNANQKASFTDAILRKSIASTTTESGFIPVTPSWLRSNKVRIPNRDIVTKAPSIILTNPRFQHQKFAKQIKITPTTSGSVPLTYEDSSTQHVPKLSYWAQIASQPILTQVQKPLINHTTLRQTQNRQKPKPRRPYKLRSERNPPIIVKHGIYPLLKSRRQRLLSLFQGYKQ